MSQANPRIIPLEGGHNFRDIGGYPAQAGQHTRTGLIYRSGMLSKLTEADRQTLTGLGIRTAFDLREAAEHEQEGVGAVDEAISIIHVPTTLGREAIIAQLQSDPLAFRMADFYKSSLAPRQTYHADVFNQLVNRLEHPLVIHCSAGKDRTGILVALLLDLVGVPHEIIVEDYALTTQHLGVDYRAEGMARYRGYGLPDSAIEQLLGSSAQNMAEFLAHLRASYGDAETYLLGGGTSAQAIARFRDRFIV